MKYTRYGSIDAYRGFAIVLMLVFNLFPLFTTYTPLLLMHAQYGLVLFGDLIAPFFQFLVGISLFISVSRRLARRQPRTEIGKHIVKRFVLLIAIGFVLDVIVYKQLAFTWGVLETLGIAGLIAYPLLKYSYNIRLGVCALFYLVYAYLSMFPWFAQTLLSLPHGSPLAVLSWAPITIVGTVFGQELLNRKSDLSFQKRLFMSGVDFLLLGFLLSLFIPFYKRTVTASYSIFALGACLMIFLVFYYLVEVRKFSFKALREFGISSLLVWIMQFVFVFYPVYYLVNRTHFITPLYSGLLVIFILIVFWIVVKVLNKYNLKLSL